MLSPARCSLLHDRQQSMVISWRLTIDEFVRAFHLLANFVCFWKILFVFQQNFPISFVSPIETSFDSRVLWNYVRLSRSFSIRFSVSSKNMPGPLDLLLSRVSNDFQIQIGRFWSWGTLESKGIWSSVSKARSINSHRQFFFSMRIVAHEAFIDDWLRWFTWR